ncbi:MAG TPA: hypothetical protein VHX87_02110, partial [Galbitalea sp.]|nr:hypothetical protein [Galbitalea sp.]
MSVDFPSFGVDEHVVVAAEEDSVFDVGFAVVAEPVVHVVGFTPAGGFGAAGEAASAVPDTEWGALPGGEEALFAAHVEGCVVVEEDPEGSAFAQVFLQFAKGDWGQA